MRPRARRDMRIRGSSPLERHRQRQMHDRLATPFGSAGLGADFAKRLRVLQVYGCRWIQEGPRLHEILKVPPELDLETLVDMDVLLSRNLTHDEGYSCDNVATEVPGGEGCRIAEITDVDYGIDARRAEAVRPHIPVAVPQLRIGSKQIGAAAANERRIVVERAGGEVEVQ